MTQTEAVEALRNRGYSEEQIASYVRETEARAPATYWSTLPSDEVLLRDMELFLAVTGDMS